MIKLLVFLLPAFLNGQTFESSTTVLSRESYLLEFMNRTIEIDQDKIKIISQGNEIIDIQTLNIIHTEEKKFGNLGMCYWYYCNSKNIPGTDKLIIVPKEKNPNQISIFEPSKDGASTKETKIIID
ncbi:hypothetical protein [Gillisia sp. Hel_I_29]|uniref:hypothetical protein n=1 Tax=Gillisia sp. Hel_I_29 TaxID=1249975 RepID=UPI00055746CE|nr:hypothetical protein [Gillisia sp. Hel_I_29]